MSEILIPIPIRSKHQLDLEVYFRGFLHDDVGDLSGEFLPALNLDLQDKRANVDAADIQHVEIKGKNIYVTYTVDYSAYFGCRDMNYAERDQRQIVGKVKRGYYVFEEHVSPEPLAPNEEL